MPPATALHIDLCRHVLGELTTDELPDVALRALLAGAESLALAALAGASPCDDPVDRRRMLDRALGEIGVVLPTVREAVETMRDVYAAEVVAGALSPMDAATKMHFLRDALEWRETAADDGLGLGVFTSAYYTYDDCDAEWADPSMRRAVDADVREACELIVSGSAAPTTGE